MNTLIHNNLPSIDGELAITSNLELATKVGANTNLIVGRGGNVTHIEADSDFLQFENVPVTRVGDLTYLPMDIKDDFKGMILPWAHIPYLFQEDDGSVVMLRPGYNGEFAGIFYSYSPLGSFASTEFRHTDSQYAPSFLGAGEYVFRILDGAPTGFLVEIRSKVDLALRRYFWIEHNGTLDSIFHTYLDVTTTYISPLPNGLSAGFQTAVYVPQASAFVIFATNGGSKSGMVWYTVDRPFQSTYDAADQPALPTKSVNWTELSGNETGSNNAPIILDASVVEKRDRYFKVINPPVEALTTFAPYIGSSGRRSISYTVSPTGIVRFLIFGNLYLVWPPKSLVRHWHASFDYDPVANTLLPVADHPDTTLYQSLPYVIDFAASTVVNSGPAPDPITDEYKANKYPLLPAFTLQSNNVDIPLIVGERMIVPQVSTTQGSQIQLLESLLTYDGTSTTERAFNAFGYFAPTQKFVARHPYNAIDASTLSKQFLYVAFTDPTTLRASSVSQLYGEPVQSRKNVRVELPSVDHTNSIYSIDTNSYELSLPTYNSTSIADWTTPQAASTFIDGDGPMTMNVMSSSSVSTTAAAFIRGGVGIDNTATSEYSVSDVALFDTRMEEFAVHLISTSSYTFVGTQSHQKCLQLIELNTTNNTALCLFTVAFGGNGAVKFEYATVLLSLAGGMLDLTPTFLSQMISSFSGPTIAGATIVGPVYLAGFENIGVYKHTDGIRYCLTQSGCYVSITGSNTSRVTLFKISSGGTILSATVLATDPTWFGTGCGVHPKYGLYSTHCWKDSSTKAVLRYADHTGTASQSTRIQNSAEALIPTSSFPNSVIIASSKSATGFVLYCSDIPVFMNGHIGTIPTQVIDLSSFDPSPANKSFNLYVTWTGSAFAIEGTTGILEDTLDRAYIGTIDTGVQGITASTIKKVTRLDKFRIDGESPLEGSSIRTYELLADALAYMFDTTTEVDAFRATNVPPSQATVFASWDRTSGTANYYPGGVGATGDAAAWSFETNPDRIVQPNNTATYESFISPEAFEDYEFEVTLHSTTGDDDLIGAVAAFARVGGVNLQLMVMRSGGGIIHPNNGTPKISWNFGFLLIGATASNGAAYQSKMVGANRGNAEGGTGWAGVYTRIRVVRRGNIIKAYASDFSATQGDVPILESSEIVIDLNTLPELAELAVASPYGYTTLSQAGSTYYDVAFSGGLDKTTAYDLEANQVWKYNFGTAAWEQSATTFQDELGYVRQVTNPDTNELYVVTEDDVYKL